MTVRLPVAVRGNISARPRPSALPIPADRRVSAFVPTPVFDRWSEESAGIRPAALEQGDNVITIANL